MSGEKVPRLGLGPVFAYERITASRHWQGYALRSLFVLMLLAALAVIWWTRSEVRNANPISGLAKVGEWFFEGVVGTQLVLVLLAAPAATAGAICLDRARGTLTHLLLTDLSDGEIVLGKLAARLVPVLGLVGCALPVLFLLTLLGGVDPDAVIGAFLVTLGVAVLGCSLALVFSLWAGKTHEALMGTYAVWGLWLLATPMVHQFNIALGSSLMTPPIAADPFQLAFAPYARPGSVDWGDYLAFVGVTWALSAVLALVAVLRLRPVCMREPVRRVKPIRVVKARGWFESLQRRLSPSLDFNPVLWREWHRGRPSRGARLVGVLFATLATVFSISALFSGTNSGTAAWVNGLQVSISLLLLSVSAATALAEERVRGSLDVLLATPLSTRQIVLGKWLGTFRRVWPLAVLPTLVLIGLIGFDVTRWPAIVLMVVFVLASGAAITSLGLALATWSSRLGRAVGLTVTVYVLVTVGWVFLALMLFGGGPENGMMMGSPFFWAGQFTWDLTNGPQRHEHAVAAIVWVLVYVFAAVALLAATLATFDRCLGRVGNFPHTPVPRRGNQPERVKEVVEEEMWEAEIS